MVDEQSATVPKTTQVAVRSTQPAARGEGQSVVRDELLRQSSVDRISTPVGKNQDGQVVFAHVNFDGDITKEFVSSLKAYLTYLETTLN